MLKFFVKDEVYKDRLAICKACAYYFSPTGQCKRCLCFMRIKAKIGHMECPQKYWEKTTEVEQPDDLPQEIIDEIIEIYPDVKTGRAKNQDVKKKMIELYNIHGSKAYEGNLLQIPKKTNLFLSETILNF